MGQHSVSSVACGQTAMVQYSKEFFRTHGVSCGVFQAVLEQFGSQGVVKLVFILEL